MIGLRQPKGFSHVDATGELLPRVRPGHRGAAQPTPSAADPVPVDAYRRGNEFKVHLDLPGVDPDSIELTVEKDILSVRGHPHLVPAEGDEIQMAERPYGEFGRQLFLGGAWISSSSPPLRGRCAHGNHPVVEAVKPRKVEIIHAGGEQRALTATTTVDG